MTRIFIILRKKLMIFLDQCKKEGYQLVKAAEELLK